MTLIAGTSLAVTANVVVVAWMLAPVVQPMIAVVTVPVERAAAPVDVASRGAEVEPTRPAPAPAVVVTPPPAPPAPALFDDAPRVCPPPRRDAPRIDPPWIDEAIDHVRPSPSNAGWIAAWNDEHVYVSTDAGRTFDRVLDGPGTVTDVGFDCFGTAIVVRERMVGLRVDGDERWLSIDGVRLMTDAEDPEYVRGQAAVVSGGPEVIVVGLADGWTPRLARSSDLGRTWRYHDLELDWESSSSRGRQRADGTIELALPSTDCEGDGITTFTIRRGRVTSDLGGLWYSEGTTLYTDDLPEGFAYGATWAGEGLVKAGETLYRVRAGRATALPYVVESDGYIADPAGRLWTVVCHRPVVAGKKPSGLTCPMDGQ